MYNYIITFPKRIKYIFITIAAGLTLILSALFVVAMGFFLILLALIVGWFKNMDEWEARSKIYSDHLQSAQNKISK